MRSQLSRLITAVLALLATLGLSACVPVPLPASSAPATPARITVTGPRAVTPEPGGALVSLDIFSGRPDPTWSLTTADTNALRAILDRLAPAPCPPLPGRLGYRGFVVHLNQLPGALPEAPTDLRAHTATVWLGSPWSDSPATVCRLDPDRRVERTLLASGASSLDAELYQVVDQELRAAR